jgi:hypothetical protein
MNDEVGQTTRCTTTRTRPEREVFLLVVPLRPEDLKPGLPIMNPRLAKSVRLVPSNIVVQNDHAAVFLLGTISFTVAHRPPAQPGRRKAPMRVE